VTTSHRSDSSGQPASLGEAIALECSRVEEDCLYSAKGSFEAARDWGRVHLMIGIPTALLAAVASVSAFNNYPALAGALAVLVAALSSVSTFLNPAEKAQGFHRTGNRYNALRARARFLREVTSRTATTPEDQATELRSILAEKDKLSQESSIIPRPAFERARRGIEAGEATYAADPKAR
jgi:hypothetical protein